MISRREVAMRCRRVADVKSMGKAPMMFSAPSMAMVQRMNVPGAKGLISTVGDEEESMIYLLGNILAIFPGVWLQRQS
jgi:hypothetical protein